MKEENQQQTNIEQQVEKFIEEVDFKNGLNPEQVERSRKKFGKNVLSPPPRTPLWLQFLEKFKDPTIILLSIAAVISIMVGFHTGHFVEGIGIIIAILLATGVAFYSEYKSAREFEILKEVKKDRVKVVRGGGFHTIPVGDLVVGDVVILEMGDRVPADGKVIKETGLYLDESLLTGESEAVEKTTREPEGESETGFPRHMVFKGTLVSDGSGEFVVTAVGDNTEMGKIAASLKQEKEMQTPLQERLEVLSKQIGYVGITFAVLIFISLLIMNYSRGVLKSWDWDTLDRLLQFFMISVTIIVVAVPEGLPMMVNMSLAYNMRKMAKANCLVKKLEASETIGSVTVICSDKTGTLTMNQMKPVWFYVGNKRYKRDELDQVKDCKEWQSIVRNSSINSTANLEFENGSFTPVGNPTEGALLGLLYERGINYWDLREEAQIQKQIPFSSERKRMVTVVKEEDQYICYEKGAPTILLEECSHVMINGEVEPLDEYRDEIMKVLKEASDNSYRVLAFTKKYLDKACPRDEKCCEEGHDHIFTGMVGISDPLRPNVAESVESCHRAGIDVKMVTGDDLNTAKSIARQCKIIKKESDIAITHNEFEKMSDKELESKIGDLKVLARSRPLDKLRLVRALHARREVVGVTGDGTNDAPALSQADVGIAMGKAGTEVAKEASDIILLDDNFKTIVTGILWGRTIYENIQRLIQFQLTVNLVALLVAFIGPFLGVNLPLTVIQLLWVNIIMDTFAAMALAGEPPRDVTMQQNPRPRDEHIITPSMLSFITLTGVFMTGVLLTLLKTNFLGGQTEIEKLTILFTTFVMFQFWNEFNCRSLHHWESPFKDITKNKMFVVIVAIIFTVQLLVVTFGGDLFRTVPLPLKTWLKIIGLTAVILPVGFLSKWIIKKLVPKRQKS